MLGDRVIMLVPINEPIVKVLLLLLLLLVLRAMNPDY